jgi:hypothetical protein
MQVRSRNRLVRRQAQTFRPTRSIRAAGIVVAICASVIGAAVLPVSPVFAYQYSSTVMADSPAAYWPSDEGSGSTLNDLAGGRNATLWNTASWSNVGLVAGSPASLVGLGTQDGYASTLPGGQTIGLPLGPTRTVEFWFSSSDANAWPEWMFSFWGGGNAGGGEGTDRWTIAIQANNAISVDDLLWGQSEYGVGCASPTYFDGKPHLVDYTGDGTTNRLYIDGTECATHDQLNNNTWDHMCGVAMGAGANVACGFTGPQYNIASSTHVGQVAVYAAALTPVQIANHASAGGSVRQPRPLIYVPGIGGSSLFADQGTRLVPTKSGGVYNPDLVPGTKLWVDPVRLATDPEADLDQLRYGGGSNPAPLVPGVNPHHNDLYVGDGGYSALVPWFQPDGYVLDQNFFIVAYDWRANVGSHVSEIDAAVQRALSLNPTADGVDVITHSMGGMLVRAWLQNGTYRSQARTVVMEGPPMMGTPDGSNALLYGKCLGSTTIVFFPWCPVTADLLQFVYRTLPGGVDLGVSPAYYQVFNGSDSQHPIAFVDRRTAKQGGTPGDTYARLTQEYLANSVTPALLGASLNYHADDLTWLSHLPGDVTAKIYLVAGTGRCTIGGIRVKATLQGSSVSRKWVRSLDYIQIDGDGTVIRQSAALSDPAKGINGAGSASVIYVNMSHAQLAGGSGGGLAVADALIHGAFVAAGVPLQPSCTTISVHSPAELLVTDSSGRRTGSVTPTTTYSEIPGASFDRIGDMKLVTLPTTGTYTASLAGTDAGESSVSIRWTINGAITQDIEYSHAQTTTSSMATLAFDAGAATAGPMSVDVNGDGRTVLTVNPAVLTGVAATDTTPPVISITSPQNGQSTVGTVRVDWSATDSESGVASTFAILDQGTAGAIQIDSPGNVAIGPGQHTLTVYAEDKAGNASDAQVTFNSDQFNLSSPVGHAVHSGATVPVRFSVQSTGQTFVFDPSVQVSLINANGQTVIGPITSGSNANQSVVFLNGSTYMTNLRTAGLPPGQYTLLVTFGSSSLTGLVATQLTLT